MPRRTSIRVLSALVVAAVAVLPLAGCGGGAAGTSADDDLIVTYVNIAQRTDVYRNQMIEMRFSAPIAPETLSERTVRVLTGPNLQTPVTGALILDGEKVYFDPTRTQAQVDRSGPNSEMDHPFGFEALTNHQIYVPAPPVLKTLTNLAGDPIREEYFTSFRTGEDYIPELVQPKYVGADGSGALSFSPPPGPGSVIDPFDGVTEVPYDAHIFLTFSEPINPETMDPSKSVLVYNLDEKEPVTGGNLRVSGTLRPSTDGKTFEFVPSFSFGPGVIKKDAFGRWLREDGTLIPRDPNTGEYLEDPYVIRGYKMEVQLTQDIQDLAGNPLEAPVVKRFRTEKAPSARLTSVITESFDNRFYCDTLNTTAEWDTKTDGRLQGGDITTATIIIMYTPDGVNSQRGGSGNNAFPPIDYPLVSEQGNQACPAWPDGCRVQASYKQADLGTAGAITQVFWGPSSNALFAATHPNIKMRLGHTKDTEGVIGSVFDDNFLGGAPLPNYDGLYDIPQRADIDPQNPQRGFWPYPELSTPFEYNGEKGFLLDLQVQPANDCQLLRYWYHGTGAAFPGYPGIRNLVATKTTAESDDFTGGGQPLVYDLELIKKRRTTVAQSRFYNTFTPAPDYGSPILSPSSQPGGATYTIEWQGASDQADPSTYTPWAATIDIADEKQYIRFRVTLVSNLNSNTLARFDEIRIPFITR